MRDPAEANEQDVAGRESSTLAAGGRLLFVDRDLLVVLMVDGPAALSAVMVHVEQYPGPAIRPRRRDEFRDPLSRC